MGFSSLNCKGCGHPALSPHATNSINRWMNSVVAILDSDDFVKGSYDGYGRVGGIQIYGLRRDEVPPRLYHTECWVVAGEPRTHDGEASDYAEDQGWFFEEGAHDIQPPRRE